MVKRLTRTGNSVAVVLDREILQATGLRAGSRVEVSTDGHVIVIATPPDPKRTARLKRITEKLDRDFGAVFKRLAG